MHTNNDLNSQIISFSFEMFNVDICPSFVDLASSDLYKISPDACFCTSLVRMIHI